MMLPLVEHMGDRMRTARAIACLLFQLFVLLHRADAAEIKVYEIQPYVQWIIITGPIVRGDERKFRDIVVKYVRPILNWMERDEKNSGVQFAHPYIVAVATYSPGGDVTAALDVG